MPIRGEHEDKAQENEELANNLESDTNYSDINDWIVTILFYTAVHFVEAELADINIHSNDHQDRRENIGRHLSSLYSDYKTLKQRSENARYQCKIMTSRLLSDSKDDLNSIKSSLGIDS